MILNDDEMIINRRIFFLIRVLFRSLTKKKLSDKLEWRIAAHRLCLNVSKLIPTDAKYQCGNFI